MWHNNETGGLYGGQMRLGDRAATQQEIAEWQASNVLPIIVSPRQIRQALTRKGWRAAVEAAVAEADQDTKDWWERATQVEEDHPEVVQMCGVLGISDAERHDIFSLAITL